MPAASERQIPRTFDWAASHARIERAIAALQSTSDPSPEDVRRILARRADQYAKTALSTSDAETVDLIVFQIDGLRFGIELSHGSAVTTLANLTTVPGLPSFYLGVLTYRGKIYPVVQLNRLLSLESVESSERRYATLIRGEHGTLGLAATEIQGVSRVRRDTIAVSPHEAMQNRIVKGIGPDSTTIIHADRLLQDARLIVDDQPEISIGIEGS